MAVIAQHKPGYRLFWLAFTMVVSLVAASIGMSAIGAVSLLLTGVGQIACFTLFQPPIEVTDLFNAGIAPIFLMIELWGKGWRDSALRRVLTQDDRSTRTDLGYFAFCATGLNTVLTIPLTLGTSQFLGALADSTFGPRPCAQLPLLLAVPAMLIAQSFVVYWYHRLMHTRFGWPLHAVHHAAEDFNIVTSARNHPVDAFAYGVAVALTEAVCGFSADAVTIAVLIIYVYTTYIHGDLPSSAWIERWIAFGPRGHGIHHAREPEYHHSNFGDLVIWDRLFGTYNLDLEGPITYGCANPDGIYQSGRPLRDMIVVEVAWLRGLWRLIAAVPMKLRQARCSATTARAIVILVIVFNLTGTTARAASPTPAQPFNLVLSDGPALANAGNLAASPQSLAFEAEMPLPLRSPLGLTGELRRDPGSKYLAHVALRMHF